MSDIQESQVSQKTEAQKISDEYTNLVAQYGDALYRLRDMQRHVAKVEAALDAFTSNLPKPGANGGA